MLWVGGCFDWCLCCDAAWEVHTSRLATLLLLMACVSRGLHVPYPVLSAQQNDDQVHRGQDYLLATRQPGRAVLLNQIESSPQGLLWLDDAAPAAAGCPDCRAVALAWKHQDEDKQREVCDAAVQWRVCDDQPQSWPGADSCDAVGRCSRHSWSALMKLAMTKVGVMSSAWCWHHHTMDLQGSTDHLLHQLHLQFSLLPLTA